MYIFFLFKLKCIGKLKTIQAKYQDNGQTNFKINLVIHNIYIIQAFITFVSKCTKQKRKCPMATG